MLSSLNSTRTISTNPLFETSINRLSSAKRINSAKDDASGLAISMTLEANLRSNQAISRSINDGISLTNTANSALMEHVNVLQNMREIAVNALNPSYGPSEKNTLQETFNQYSQTIDSFTSQANFNSQNLLDGSLNVNLPISENPASDINFSISDKSLAGLSLTGLDITTQAGAQNSIAAIDSAISNIASDLAKIGATSSSLSMADINNKVVYENVSASKSRILDADFSQETSNLALANIKQKATFSAHKVYLQNLSAPLNFINSINTKA